jgi:hypothetical protein
MNLIGADIVLTLHAVDYTVRYRGFEAFSNYH